MRSDIERPRQALNEHPRPTDHRDGKGSEIEESKRGASAQPYSEACRSTLGGFARDMVSRMIWRNLTTSA
jgi:hypothetical protein